MSLPTPEEMEKWLEGFHRRNLERAKALDPEFAKRCEEDEAILAADKARMEAPRIVTPVFPSQVGNQYTELHLGEGHQSPHDRKEAKHGQQEKEP